MMNTEELKYRFTEIATTIDLLPEVNMEDDSQPDTDEWRLPNGTLGLSQPMLFSALICQTLKGGQDYRFKMVATMTNTAIESIKSKNREGQPASEDDLTALAISINILWANGVQGGLLQLLGLLQDVTCKNDLEVPDLAMAIFRPQGGVDKFSQLDPMRILEDKGLDDMLSIFNAGDDDVA